MSDGNDPGDSEKPSPKSEKSIDVLMSTPLSELTPEEGIRVCARLAELQKELREQLDREWAEEQDIPNGGRVAAKAFESAVREQEGFEKA